MKNIIAVKSNLIFLSLIIAFKLSWAQTPDTMKVLFIGNSFTSNFNLPTVFSQLAQGSNKPVVVAAHMPGGISVGDISQGTSAHMFNPIVYSLIKNNDWDYLVLQDNQGRFVYNYGIFPATSLVIEGHLKIRDSLLFYHPCAKMIWFAGWGPKTGYPPYASTGSGLIDKIYNNYKFLLDTAGQIIAPIGPAWQRIIANYPSVNLWDTDDVHPGLNGTSLTADVIYSTIFKTTPIQSTYVPFGIPSSIDSLFKNIGFQTVIDSLNFTGLQTITPIINRFGNTLTISGYSVCNWYLNDVFLASNTGTLNIYQTGNYTAIVYDINNCEFRTLAYNVSLINSISDNFNNSIEINVFPNPTIGKITIESLIELKNIQVLDILGQELIVIKKPNNTESLNLSFLHKGIYYIKITDSYSKVKIEKVILE